MTPQEEPADPSVDVIRYQYRSDHKVSRFHLPVASMQKSLRTLTETLSAASITIIATVRTRLSRCSDDLPKSTAPQYATMPDNFITFCSTVVLPKRELSRVTDAVSTPHPLQVMLNSMLSLLNSRRTLREINHADFVSIRLSTLPSSNATGQSLENRERRVIERRVRLGHADFLV